MAEVTLGAPPAFDVGARSPIPITPAFPFCLCGLFYKLWLHYYLLDVWRHYLAPRVAIEESCTNSLVNIRSTGKFFRAYSLEVSIRSILRTPPPPCKNKNVPPHPGQNPKRTWMLRRSLNCPSLSECCKCNQRDFSCWSVRSGTLLRCEACPSVYVLWDVKKKKKKRLDCWWFLRSTATRLYVVAVPKKKQATFLWPFY